MISNPIFSKSDNKDPTIAILLKYIKQTQSGRQKNKNNLKRKKEKKTEIESKRSI